MNNNALSSRFVEQVLISLKPHFIPYNTAVNDNDKPISPRKVTLTGQYYFCIKSQRKS